jgi:hypothetical protein
MPIDSKIRQAYSSDHDANPEKTMKQSAETRKANQRARLAKRQDV